MNTKSLIGLIVIVIVAFTSCTPVKNIAYLEDINNSEFAAKLEVPETPLRINDVISVKIGSLNSEASEIFNQGSKGGNGATTASGGSAEASGYLINSEGNIQLPVLGYFHVAGFTKTQLKNQIIDSINTKKLLLNPVVEIRMMNYEVTILGEVAHPTVINVPAEKISLVKALGLAGDLTIYGIRTNILLIREENGKRITRILNINDKKFITSEYYYLQPNDVVYVQPNKTKSSSSGKFQQYLPYIMSGGITALVLVVDRLIK